MQMGLPPLRSGRAACVLAAAWLLLASGLSAQRSLENQHAPPFSLQDMQGRRIDLAQYRGKVVLLNFWATWCAPCKLETPWLIELRNQYAKQGFEVLGVSSQGDDATPKDTTEWNQDKQAIEKFVHQERIPYPVLLGGDSIAQPYGGVADLPTSFYVNRKGIVVAAQMGLTSESEMAANIRKALAD
jgi:cytochrome c biogenesis protein CcmG/thiol:disulfide interchange protein DsbE